MIERKYLPLGTICKLKDANKNVMIIGFYAVTENGVYDYIACDHPEGVVGDRNESIVFNHDQIEKIINMGFVNDDVIKFKRRLDLLGQGDLLKNITELDEETQKKVSERFSGIMDVIENSGLDFETTGDSIEDNED
jgi:hypothetical protein